MRKKKKLAPGDAKAQPPPQSSQSPRLKASLLSLEPRLMFDAAAAATAAEVNTEQVAQEQAEAAVSGENAHDSQTQEGSGSRDLLQAISTFMPNESQMEVVFVDPTVPNYQELLNGMDPNIEVVMLDGEQDGVEQMATALSGRTGIDAIHLISHGSAGTLQLGTGTLNIDSMSGQYAEELATIQQALSEQADILVYGCDFAEGDVGQTAVNLLAEMTGADVQASIDETGHISLGGDWEFEVSTGTIETSLAISDDAQMNWTGILGTETVRDTFSSTSYSNNNGTQAWSTSWSETDAGGGDASGGDVRVSSSQLRIDTDTVGNAISRGVNLSGATSATLTFDYTNALLGADRIELRVSTGGGSNYQTVSGGIFSNAANTGSGTASFDLSGYMSANTRIQFIVTGTGGGERLYVDNVQVSYQTNSTSVLADMVLTLTVAEDAGAPSGAVGSLVSAFTGGITDVGSGASKGIAITGTNETNGSWYYTTNGGSTWTAVGAVSDTSALLLADNGSTRLYFAPNADYNGTVSDAITFRAWDQTSGSNGSTVSLISSQNVLDSFGSVSYSNNYGSVNWASAWQEIGESDGAGSGDVRVDEKTGLLSTYELRLDTDVLSKGISRAVNLTGATSATLSFNYARETGAGQIAVEVYNGASWRTLTTLNINTTDTAVQSYSADISADANANTQIRFRVTQADANSRLLVDDVRIAYTASNTGGTTDTVDVTVTAVNDAPTVSGLNGTPTYTENGAAVVLDSNVAISDPELTAADNFSGATLTLSRNGGANGQDVFSGSGTLSLSGGNVVVGGTTIGTYTNSSGTLVMTFNSTATNALVNSVMQQIAYSNSSDAPPSSVQVNWTFSDGNSGTQGTGGALTATGSVTVNITAVNDAPELTDTALLLTVAEGAGAPSGAVGALISAFSGGITEPDGGVTKGIAITGTNETNGTWYYTTNGGSTWTAVGAVSNTAALLLADNGSTRLYFSPNANYNGTSTSALTVRAWDQTNGTAGTKVSTASNGGTTAFSSATDMVDVTVTPVNDAPTDLSLSANTVTENAANGTVVGTITGTDPDNGDSKTYSFTDSASGRFAIDPSTGVITVANSSLLNYEAATSYSVTVRVTDAGGLTYDDLFTINLTNVNEAPTGADATVTITEDTAHTVTPANFGFSDVDAGDSLSAVRIDTLPSAGSLTLSGVAVTAGQVVSVADITVGNLVFTPAANANGTSYASFTFSVRDSNNAYDAAPNTLMFNVTAVNDAPVNTIPGAQTVAVDTPLAISGLSVSDVDGNLTTVQLSVTNGTVAVTLSGGVTISSGASGTSTLTLIGTQVDINATLSSLTYQGNSLFTGTDTLTMLSTDGNGASDTDTVTITVSNNAPTNVLPAPQTVTEDTPLTISGLSVTDIDGNLASVQLSATYGTLSITLSGAATISSGSNGSGTVTLSGTQADLNATLSSLSYQGNLNFTGFDTLTITSTDSTGTADTDSLSITVISANDAPTDLALSSNTVAENAANGAIVGTVSGTDPDSGDTKSYSFTDSAGGRFAINSATGQITVANGSLLNYESATTSHTVTVRVTDSGGLTYDETFTITLTNVNEAPTGADATITINEDTFHTLTTANFGFSDVDAGDSLSAVRIDSLPGAGSLTLSGVAVTAGEVIAVSEITAGHLVFTPAADANGTGYVSVTFSVQDNHGAYDVGPNTLTFNVTATDDAPVNHVPGSQTVAVDTPLAITGLSVTDVDGNLTSVQLSVNNGTLALTLSGSATVTGGAIGSSTLTISGSQADLNTTLASLIYQGASLYTGPDTLTVLSTETGGLTDTDTMGITVSNNAPTNSLPASQTVAEDTPLAISGISVVDADGNLTMVELSVSHGTLGVTLSVGATISAGSNGSDSLTLSGTQAALNATLASVTYQGNLNFSGLDTLTITSTDSTGTSDMDNLSITVTSVNDAPTAISVMPTTVAETVANGTIVGTASTTDPDEGDTHTYQLLDSAGGRFAINSSTGVITVADGTLLDYEAATSHTITVRTTDAGGLVHDQSFIINLTDVNETPTDLILSANTVAENAANGTVIGTVSGTDPDSGDTKAYSFTDSAGGRFAINSATGQITVANGSLLNYESATSHSVTVRVTDAGGLTYDETFTINLTDVNETPTAVGLSGNAVAENATNGTVVGTASTTDPDAGDTHTYSLTDSASGRFAIDTNTGQITVADGSLLDYEAATSHTIMVRTTDAGGLTYDQIFTINLTNVNEAPTGVDGSITINEDTSYALTTANFGFSDVDAGDSLSAVRIDSLPGVGTLTLSGVNVTAGQVIAVSEITAGNLVFTPTVDATGIGYASFTFSVRDSNNAYDPAPNTLTFDVMAVNDAPVNTVPGAQTVAEDTPLSISGLSVNDVDGNLSTVQLGVVNGTVSVTLQGGATISAGSNGTNSLTLSGSQADINATLATLVYQGTPSFNGADTLTVTSMDSGSDVDTVAITVTAVNDAPVLAINTGSTAAEGGTDTIDSSELAVTDVDNSAAQLTYTIGTGPLYGRLELTTAPGITATTFTQADIAAGRLVYIHDGSETTSDSFTFTVNDGAGGGIGATTMTLTITPVNNAPTITSDGGASTASINVAENVSAITIVTGADVDLPAQALTYSISGGVDQARFTINTVTGSLNFVAPANFEAATDANGDNVYVVQVQVTASQGANTIQTIHVTVTDVVENAPSTPPTIPPVLLLQPPVPPGPGTPPSAGPPPSDHGPGPPVKLHPISQEPLTLVLSPDRPVAWVPEEPRKPTDDVKETPLFLVNDDQRRPLFTVLPVEPTAILEPEPPETKQSASDLLMAKLDEMTISLEQAMSVSQEQREIVARVAAVTGITLSAGFITWALRSGTLLASCLATMPAWRHFDPLPVVRLSRAERTRRREEMARAGQQEATEFSGLKRVLDDKPTLKRTA